MAILYKKYARYFTWNQAVISGFPSDNRYISIAGFPSDIRYISISGFPSDIWYIPISGFPSDIRYIPISGFPSDIRYIPILPLHVAIEKEEEYRKKENFFYLLV